VRRNKPNFKAESREVKRFLCAASKNPSANPSSIGSDAYPAGPGARWLSVGKAIRHNDRSALIRENKDKYEKIDENGTE
jgi:hypothetical protein